MIQTSAWPRPFDRLPKLGMNLRIHLEVKFTNVFLLKEVNQSLALFLYVIEYFLHFRSLLRWILRC